MREIYIMLTQLGTLVSKSIRFYTKAKYNHVSVGTDPELRVFYSFGRRVRHFPLIGGFVTEVVDKGIFKDYPESECMIYSLPVDDPTYEVFCRNLDQYIKNARKFKYNLLGFLGVLFNIPVHSEYRNTCAEFAAKLLHNSNIYLFSKNFSLVRPDEFHSIPGLNLVFEGTIRELNWKYNRE